MNAHSFSPNGHDNKIFDKFCKVSSVFAKDELLDIIVQNWCDDQDLQDITQTLIDRLSENGLDENGDEIVVKVILPKGSELEWEKTIPYYVAKAGAKAILTKDYTTIDDFVSVEFIDELGNGQGSGGYYRDMFKVVNKNYK